MAINQIKSENEYRAALKVIKSLMQAKPGTPAGNRFEALAPLVEAWEKKRHSIEPPDPIDAIKFAMEQRGLTRKDIEHIFGSRARVAEILNYKRPLTLAMIRKLHLHLKIPAEVLIAEPRRKSAA